MGSKLDLESSRAYLTNTPGAGQKPRSSLARNMGRVLLSLLLACFLVALTTARRCRGPLTLEKRVDKILSETPLIGRVAPNVPDSQLTDQMAMTIYRSLSARFSRTTSTATNSGFPSLRGVCRDMSICPDWLRAKWAVPSGVSLWSVPKTGATCPMQPMPQVRPRRLLFVRY